MHAAPVPYFHDYNRGQHEAEPHAKRKEKHRYLPFYPKRVSEAVAVIGLSFGIGTGRSGRDWSGCGVDIRQSL
jgi:hypothetical protein